MLHRFDTHFIGFRRLLNASTHRHTLSLSFVAVSGRRIIRRRLCSRVFVLFELFLAIETDGRMCVLSFYAKLHGLNMLHAVGSMVELG